MLGVAGAAAGTLEQRARVDVREPGVRLGTMVVFPACLAMSAGHAVAPSLDASALQQPLQPFACPGLARCWACLEWTLRANVGGSEV